MEESDGDEGKGRFCVADVSTYYIDIDGVLCTNTNGDYEAAQPIQPASEAVRRLYDSGHTIVLWTARGATTTKDWRKVTLRQMSHWDVPHHELRLDKPHYDFIVDDKCTLLHPA